MTIVKVTCMHVGVIQLLPKPYPAMCDILQLLPPDTAAALFDWILKMCSVGCDSGAIAQ